MFLNDEEIPQRSTANISLNITNDISQSLDALAGHVADQLAGQMNVRRTDQEVDQDTARMERSEQPHSPTGSPTGLIRRNDKRKDDARGKECERRKKRRNEDVQEEEVVEGSNSKDFPREDRPDLFKDDKKFDKLSYETAAKICWEYKQLKDKKEMKAKKSASLEKADDKLPVVKVEAGEDDAKSLFCDARRVLRPPVVEMKNIMSWYPTKWDEIIRNLPLDIYSLNDSVISKSIELCHNL